MKISTMLAAAAATLAMISACATQQTAEEAAAEVTPPPTFTQEEIAAMSTEEKLAIHNEHVADDKDRLVCRKRMVTGSHRKVTECHTVAELEEQKKAADKLLQEAVDHSSGVQRQ